MNQSDEYEEADTERRRLLQVPCGECGQGAGYLCVGPGGRELSIHRQHEIRFKQAGIRRGVLRALLDKAGLL